MKWLRSAICLSIGINFALEAQDTLDKVRQLERRGDALAARTLLARAAQDSGSAADLLHYAEFLDRYGDAGCRAVYEKALSALERSGDRQRQASIQRRLLELDLIAGNRESAARRVEAYRSLGGKAESWRPAPPPDAQHLVTVPGPMRSFGRMAALSTDLKPEEVMEALARNVVTNGYQASHSNEALEQTEYLKLVHRYLSQARELEKLAGPSRTIRIETCESPAAGELLRILGYRMRGGCGSEVVLETVNATRAFLTTDSGFPLAELEQDLRTNRPFVYDFSPTKIPILYPQDYLIGSKEKQEGEFIDIFLSDPSLCRLYLGLSKLEPATAEELRKALPVQRLRAFAHVLDFYGAMFRIRDGKAVTTGGPRAREAWAELVGVSPDQGVQFFERLIMKDDGWMASYFDALSRLKGPVHDYLTEPNRMKRFYAAIRGKVTSPGPARPVFRSNADMMLLTTRLRLGPDGKPHIPGSLEVWRGLFVNHPHGKYDGKLTRIAATWKDPDDVLEALFALCRKSVENEPLKIFMALSDLDRNREKPLAPATVDRLAREYRFFGAQYAIFNDGPAVSDATILQFLDTAQAINKIRDQLLRADAAGTMQALVGMWQIFSRQGVLAPAESDAVLSNILAGFAKIGDDRELFDSGRGGVRVLLKATRSRDDATPQEHLIDLLAGVERPSDVESHNLVVQEMMRILEAQRVVSLNTLFELADHLEAISRGERMNTALVNRLAGRIAEIQLPRASLSSVERNAIAFGYWTEKHIDEQRRVNLRAVIARAAGDAEKLKSARGLLTPFLRDTLVALNYAHYAPPGAQVLYTNPLFVRGHDFLGLSGSPQTWRSTELFGTGWPSNGGGRLVGSLSGLPYALAEAEQNFLVPSQTQALIWGDLVPHMILSAKIPRWWKVTPAQTHWVGLHLRYGQKLLAQAAFDPAAHKQVMEVLETQAQPRRAQTVSELLSHGEVAAALEKVTPSELFLLASDAAPRQPAPGDPCLAEIRRLGAEVPGEVNEKAISRAFGTPKPTLANSYRPELLNLRVFPALMGYSSRIMAESWESNTLYWAALADEVHVPPSQLNVRIPEWTQQLIERIFASNLEDWPAVLRSLRMVGDDVRAKLKLQVEAEQKVSLN
ncbi:MAG: hypothetical protein IT158_25675 [Bryobacterales bacterium]|nr:hypothetical protein [Bryobacterales bacterium]